MKPTGAKLKYCSRLICLKDFQMTDERLLLILILMKNRWFLTTYQHHRVQFIHVERNDACITTFYIKEGKVEFFKSEEKVKTIFKHIK